jgi:hypothetical protein
MVGNKMEPSSNTSPCRGCWLHRSIAMCVSAIAFWIYWLIVAALEMMGVFHPKADWLLVPAYGVVIWLFATFAAECKQRLERWFYCVGIAQEAILAACAAIPMLDVGRRLWFCEFMNATLSAIEIVLSGTILLWHFRTRMDGSHSKEPT